MTLIPPPHMAVVKKEDKETKLRDFFREALNNLSANGERPVLRVLARGSHSPVVRAMTAFDAELSATGVEIRLMLTNIEPGDELMSNVRHLADIRCLDAHELLVLGAKASWIGDCMRRDPSVRDSFELHALTNELAAKQAATSFDRLWGRIAAPKPVAVAETVMEMAADLSALPVEQTAPQVLTRH